MIFCGYKFMDGNLRILFDEIIKDGDNRPRHYIVSKGVKQALIDYWRDRRVVAIDTWLIPLSQVTATMGWAKIWRAAEYG